MPHIWGLGVFHRGQKIFLKLSNFFLKSFDIMAESWNNICGIENPKEAMKMQIVRACGHVEKVHGIRKADRDNVYRHLESTPCRECYLREQDEKMATANAKRGLPALEGTEKQVRWAEAIRAEMLRELDAIEIEGTPKPEWFEARRWIEARTEAGWWIARKVGGGYREALSLAIEALGLRKKA